MTNPNKVYDTTLNLNHSKSQLISTTSNAFISANSQPIWVKLWILHFMTNPNKVYDTTPNFNHLKSQLISTTSNAYISDNSQPILFKLWILPHYHYHTKSQVILQLKISKSHIISTISKYMIPLKISTNLNHFKCLYLSQF